MMMKKPSWTSVLCEEEAGEGSEEAEMMAGRKQEMKKELARRRLPRRRASDGAGKAAGRRAGQTDGPWLRGGDGTGLLYLEISGGYITCVHPLAEIKIVLDGRILSSGRSSPGIDNTNLNNWRYPANGSTQL